MDSDKPISPHVEQRRKKLLHELLLKGVSRNHINISEKALQENKDRPIGGLPRSELPKLVRDELDHLEEVAEIRQKMVDALVAAGKPFDLMVLPGWGHFGGNKEIEDYWMEACRTYLQEHLKP